VQEFDAAIEYDDIEHRKFGSLVHVLIVVDDRNPPHPARNRFRHTDRLVIEHHVIAASFDHVH
jgi:hypothetical protein